MRLILYVKRGSYILTLVTYFLFLQNSKAQNIISTVAGNGTAGYSGDSGISTIANLANPYYIVFDTANNYFISDFTNNRIRKVSNSGIITTVAGTGINGYSGDTGLAISAEISQPVGIAIDKFGSLYIADWGNNRIRKIDGNGIITTIAGTGVSGYSGDNGLATLAKIKSPEGITFDTTGNLYFSEELNNTIRRITPSGIITTIAGNGTSGYSGDNGPATGAQLNSPGQICFDPFGNLLVADVSNSCIRKIDNSGTITTIAGNGIAGYSGDNGLATTSLLRIPFGVTSDAMGNIFISDTWNYVIRKISINGIITTIAGNGSAGYSGDNGNSMLCEMNRPAGLAFDSMGNLFISDLMNNCIRKVTNVGNMVVEEKKRSETSFKIYPNPNTGSFSINLTGKGKTIGVEIYNVFGQQIINKQYNISNTEKMQIEGLAEGVYMVKLIINGIQQKSERIIVTK